MTPDERDRRIDDAIDAALRELPAIDPSLVDHARRALHDEPHRFVPIGAASLALEGVLNLRLAIAHTSLTPSQVGAARGSLAADAVRRLDEVERTLAPSVDGDEADLAYRTARFLEPPPPFTGAELDEPAPEVLATLVARWERAHEASDANEPLGSWIRRKAKQHLQFYRIGFSFPFYEARRRRIHRRLPDSVRRNPGMLETFEALEQLGPVLDNFVFDRGVSATFRDDVAIADLVFLLMQLADELVDNLVKLGGAGALERLLDEHFGEDARDAVFIPFESLDAASLSRAGIDPQASVPKYWITVDELVATLADLRAALIRSIDASEHPERTRGEVRAFFHHCFATFLDELDLPRLASTDRLDRLPRATVAWHFHRKNDDVMATWLAIRARLLGLDPRTMPELLARWGRLLASFQVFDDLKDLAVDLGHQPNYPIALAHHHHPRELSFLETSFGTRDRSIDRNEAMLLAVRMPGTVRDCLRLGRLLALSSFDWFLDYVADYRWRRNWLVRARSFHAAPASVDRPIERGALSAYDGILESGVPVVDAIFRFLAATEGSITSRELDDDALGFVLDVVGYDHGPAILLALFPRIPTMYRFVNLRMRMTSRERADVLRWVVAHHRSASERALLGLRDASGSDALAHRIARAFDLALPGRSYRLPVST